MKKRKTRSIRTRLILPVMITLAVCLVVNLLIFHRINVTTNSLEAVYDTNIRLSEMKQLVRDMETDIFQYLNVRDMESYESFMKEREDFGEMLLAIDETIGDQTGRKLERNIRELGTSYLQLTETAIKERQDNNSAAYQATYAEIESVYTYLLDNISGLDALRFRTNSQNYDTLYRYLRYLEIYMTFVQAAVILNLMVILWMIIGNMTKPLERLAVRAGEIGDGNFDPEPLEIVAQDEVGTVTEAFNQMVVSIDAYIRTTKESMQRESEMRERELTMENLLKNAQLNYYQAQINPHFLFNTLNAGQQLAMMEDADLTYSFMENLAQFFRYRLKKNGEESTIRDEIGLIDSYMYIMNVRYSGEINLYKEVDERLLDCLFPGMILQPIVENALTHGLAEVEWDKEIYFSVLRDRSNLLIEIKDNGKGISKEILEKLNHGEYQPQERASGNGVGLLNVRERLRLYYRQEDVLFIESEGEGKGTTIRICVPMEQK